MTEETFWLAAVSLTALWWGQAFSVPPHIEPCILKCKDAHMLHLRSALGDISEWSIEFLMPLQSILKQSRDPASVTAKLNRACSSSDKYEKCLSHCPRSIRRVLLLLGMEPWAHICNTFRSGDLMAIVPCWRDNIVDIQGSCPLRYMQEAMDGLTDALGNPSTTKEKFGKLCGSIRKYDRCHLALLNRYCSSKAGRYFSGLNEVTNNTLHTLLKYSSISESIPKSCGQVGADEVYEQHLYEERGALQRDVWINHVVDSANINPVRGLFLLLLLTLSCIVL